MRKSRSFRIRTTRYRDGIGVLRERINQPVIGGPGEADATVVFGGVTFTPGQRLVADEDGVVVLPMGLIESDIDTASSVAATAAYASGTP